MKFHYFFIIIEFFLVFISLIFPSIITPPRKNPVEYLFSPYNLLFYGILSILLFFLASLKYTAGENNYPEFSNNEKKPSRISLRVSLIGFIVLFIISFNFEVINSRLNLNPVYTISDKSFVYKILCILQILVLSFYEEVLFRKYLVTKLEFFIKSRYTKLNLLLPVFISAALFSLCHLYSGWISSLFSFTAALIFSVIYKKTRNILYPWIPHALYNILIFLRIN